MENIACGNIVDLVLACKVVVELCSPVVLVFRVFSLIIKIILQTRLKL